MSLVVRMKEGDRTPTLYTWYDKKYNFDDLQREADYGLEEYINTLKRGDKDEEKFRQAYSDIMSGIKDGSITFKDGRYIDSKGRYTNGTYYDQDGKQQSSKRKSKDYYGLMANYIYKLQSRGKEYIPPEDSSKIKWDGGAGARTALMRSIFNSDEGNLQDFLDLDPYDENAKKRLTTNRAKELARGFQNTLTNFDSLFTGFEDADKATYTENATKAIQALNDGTIDSGDYLALSRAISGINYRNWFSDQSQNDGGDLNENEVEAPRTQVKFIDWVKQKYPRFTGQLRQPKSLVSHKTYGPEAIGTLEKALSATKDLDLYRILQMYLVDPKYVFNNEPLIVEAFNRRNFDFTNEFGIQKVLQALKNKNLLHSFGDGTGKYYIPRMNTKRQTSWVWDELNNTLSEMSYHDIPYWREKIKQEYNSQYGNESEDDSYFNELYASHKSGGVILAQTGVKLGENANWYTGVFQPQLTHILEGLDKDKGYYSWLNDMQDRHNELYTAAGSDFLNKAYKADTVGTYQDLYKSGYQTEWNGNPAGYNSLGISNAQKLGMFDISGRTRTSGDWVGKWNTDNLYSGITDYRRLLGRKGDYTDEQLASTVASFKEKGYDFVEDANGYYKLNPIETPTEAPEDKVEVTPEVEDSRKETRINPITETPKIPKPTFSDFISGITPDLIGAGRLFGSLRTNNKVADIVRKSISPVLQDTYELYSPVTGAFSEMQLRNSQAADVRRQAARPFTSDASLQLAGALDANRQAADLERQGFLADDAEIKRTKAEALRRQEDNIARRMSVANANRASINQANRELAQLEATRLKQNWLSVDNFLQGVESRARTKYEANKQRRDNFRLQTAVSDIDSQYQDAIQEASRDIKKWQTEHPNVDITTAGPIYDDYVNKVRELQRWRSAQTYGIHAGVYGYSYNNPYLSKTPQSILGRTFKNGGTLNPSIQYLIRKVIRNENNT